MSSKTIIIKSLWDCKFLEGENKEEYIYGLQSTVQPEAHQCHCNAQRTCMYHKEIGYCEGWIHEDYGHCFNSYQGEYFDIRLKKGETIEAEVEYETTGEDAFRQVTKNRCWTFLRLCDFKPMYEWKKQYAAS